MRASVGVIGGSGLYALEGLSCREHLDVETPFGTPSGPYGIVEIEGRSVAFLARHGAGHRMTPSAINYRANIFGFKLLGVERILSVSAVGSLSESIHPNDIVLPDQFYDCTRTRAATFFDGSVAAHVEFADPVCPELRRSVSETVRQLGHRHHNGGCYVCIEGPQFSTRAESAVYRRLGMTVIGMTNATEAKLAREAEICYVTLAMVTDYDCWFDGESVSVDLVVGRLRRNAAVAEEIILKTIPGMSKGGRCSCNRALKGAIITAPDEISGAERKRLMPLIGRYIDGGTP